MQQIALKDAQLCLPEIIGMVAEGEEIIITKDDGAAFRILPVKTKAPYPKFGSAKGLIEIKDDFDDPIEGFEEYMS